MSISFTRSMRSLRADAFGVSLAGMIAAGVLLIAWGAWFVFAPIPVRESTDEYRFARDGSVLADFPQEAQARIVPGQSARLIVGGAAGEPELTIPALVMDTPNRLQSGERRGMVVLSLLSTDLPLPGASGRVEIDVETISPAAYILRLQAGNHVAQTEP